jgi:hypothetical protein
LIKENRMLLATDSPMCTVLKKQVAANTHEGKIGGGQIMQSGMDLRNPDAQLNGAVYIRRDLALVSAASSHRV